MLYLNQVTIKYSIWQNYNNYIMIIRLLNKVISMRQIFKLKKYFVLKLFMYHFYSHDVPRVHHH
jgi:hypothetical protein